MTYLCFRFCDSILHDFVAVCSIFGAVFWNIFGIIKIKVDGDVLFLVKHDGAW